MKVPLKSFFPFLIILALVSSGCRFFVKEPARDSFAFIEKLFNDPPPEYRPAPLWVWHDVLSRELIREHLVDFKDKGIGGVFVHPRYGLVTEYLSNEWFDMFGYTLEVAKELDMYVWIYDENSFPSGFAGGLVPALMPESYNQGQGLVIREQQVFSPDPDVRYLHFLKADGQGGYVPVHDVEAEAGMTGDYYLFELIDYGRSKWHAGYSYVDLLVPGVTEKFMEVTMEGYEQFSEHFGNLLPGVFTDEPNIAPPGGHNSIRWTPDLYERFYERWGYRLEDNLMSLYIETGDWKRVRHNYFQLLLQLFIDRWSKPWFEYTEEKNLLWTGHYWEHGWPSPHHGGDNMAMYAWHQLPGIDLLFNTMDQEEYPVQFGDPRLVKELKSVANQMGRRRTFSETYGAAGWELTFEEMKRLGDWAYVLGLNFLNPHMNFMTLLGDRKHDFPQSFSYHTPYWDLYRYHTDYFARLSLALSTGTQHNDILVLEPTTTTWMYYSSYQSNQHINEIGRKFQDLLDKLEAYQIEYDLGSENIIKDHGHVREGRFGINQREYSLVVLPFGMENLDIATFELLSIYLEQGGRVISLEHHPTKIEGMESDDLIEHIGKYPLQWLLAGDFTDPAVADYFLSDEISFSLQDHTPRKLFHQRRRLDDGQLIFLANTSMEVVANGSFSIAGNDVVMLDAETGSMYTYPHTRQGDRMQIDFSITPAGSLLLFISDKQRNYPEWRLPEASRLRSLETTRVKIRPLEDNVLLLDYCKLILPGRDESPLMYYYSAGNLVWQHHGFPDNPWANSVQFRRELVDHEPFGSETGYELIFPFDVAEGTDLSSLKAVAERPDIFRVSVNGIQVDLIDGKWYLDQDFGVYDIGSYLHSGGNQLSVKVSPMHILAEVAPVFITGNFALEPAQQGWRIAPATDLELGAWRGQGFPFYSGGMAYSTTVNLSELPEQAFVVTGNWSGTVAEVRVNGQHAGIIGWRPNRLEIGEVLQPGENEITVVVYGSLKNLLGPHHHVGRRGIVTPWSFKYAPQVQPAGEDYDLLDYGMDDVINVSVVPGN